VTVPDKKKKERAKVKTPKRERLKPLSLYPLSFDEAISVLVKSSPEKKKK
jgi:hypothetical protein